MKLSIVIPTLNEAKNIKKIIDAFLQNYDKSILEIIIVDDDSPDKTWEIAGKLAKKNKKIKVIRRRAPHGVGFAIRDGVRAANPNATHILSIDADYIINMPYIKNFFEKIDDYDGLVGSRYILPGSIRRYSFAKKASNRTFHFLIKVLFGINQKDLTNNFKFYKKEIFDTIPITSRGFSANAETGIFPHIYGYKIGEIPVKYYGRTSDMGISKFNLMKVGPHYARIIFLTILLKMGLQK